MRAMILIGCLLLTALAGCTTDASQGAASVYVKDAPTDDWDEIHVVFTKTELSKSGEGEGEGDGSGDGEGSGGGWITLTESNGTDVDLLNASGSRAAFLGEAELDAGRYAMLRVHVDSAYGIDKEGMRHEFAVSSGTVKAPGTFEIEEDKETRIIVDFDLDRPGVLVQTGNGWRMTPVVGSVDAEIVEDDESGADAHEEGEVTEIE